MKESENRRIGAGVCKSRKLRQSAAQKPSLLPGGKIAAQIGCVAAEAGDASPNHSPESTLAIIEGVMRVAEASIQKAEFAATATATETVSDLAQEALSAQPDRIVTAPHKKPRSSEAAEAPFAQPEKPAAADLPVMPEAFRVSVGYATAAAEEICGDTAISSGLPDGSLALILSDGMGKGIRAAAMSRSVANRLRKNLKAGMAPANAIKEVNAYIVSHSESENFATVDLLIIDRNTQRAKFYKMGAASSFVLRAGRVKRFEQAALPIGIIPKIRLTHITMQLRAGDIVLVVSDGITEAGMESQEVLREEGRESEEAAREFAEIEAEAKANANGDIDGSWLRELLENRTFEELAGTSPRKLARWILEETVKQYGERERDDLTVAVVKALER